jgi:hypothetical protein
VYNASSNGLRRLITFEYGRRRDDGRKLLWGRHERPTIERLAATVDGGDYVAFERAVCDAFEMLGSWRHISAARRRPTDILMRG